MKDRKQTKASKVFECLRQDILSGKLAPLERLPMEQLKDKYKVGYSPLREALSRLVTGGLVQVEEQCGFCVAPLSLEEFQDLYQLRITIETIALELSIDHGDESWEAELVSCWYQYSKYLQQYKKFDPNKWNNLQKEFTTSLIKACQSPWLLKIREMLFDHGSRYRFLCMDSHYHNKVLLAQFEKENQQLVTAVLARDKEKAIKLLKKNWQRTITIISDGLKQKLSQE